MKVKHLMSDISFFDGHNDTISKIIFKDMEVCDFCFGSSNLHIDLKKIKQAGFLGGLFACFVSPFKSWEPEKEIKIFEGGYDLPTPEALDQNYSAEYGEKIFNCLNNVVKVSEGQLKIIERYSDIENCMMHGKTAVVIHFEGAEMIKKDLSNLDDYYNRGLRSIGLVWSRSNDFASGVSIKFPSTGDTGPGLTEHGKALVRECNKKGILVDLAHITERGFYDVAEITEKPLVVSHCGMNSVAASSRNLTDAQLKMIEDSNGIAGIFFSCELLNPKGELGGADKLSYDLIVQHLDYAVQKIGVDHVVLGSDFDGCTLPGDMKNLLDIKLIFENLKDLGYKKEDLEKIAHKNWLRVLKTTMN